MKAIQIILTKSKIMRKIFVVSVLITMFASLSAFENMTDTVVCTVYNAVPEQTNSDPEHTAFMFKLDLSNPYKHRIIAVSRDLLVKYPKGTKVVIKGTSYDGIYTVMDKMNKRYTKRIDILINEDMPIGKWNRTQLIKIK
jgi:3D (Asp-Asp-Asp) domain-containing protein